MMTRKKSQKTEEHERNKTTVMKKETNLKHKDKRWKNIIDRNNKKQEHDGNERSKYEVIIVMIVVIKTDRVGRQS